MSEAVNDHGRSPSASKAWPERPAPQEQERER
jgi:hypothetical protein